MLNKEIVNSVKEQAMRDVSGRGNITDDEVKDIIENIVFGINNQMSLNLSPAEIKGLVDTVFNSMRRLDVLQPLLEDDDVTEIMINGPTNIFTERKGRVSKEKLAFESKEKLEDIIQKIVGEVDRIVNEASPIVDARLKDGSRVNAVLPPIALNGPILTIRKFGKEPMTMDRLIGYGSLSKENAELLSLMVKAKFNIFVSGGTGSGKTTFLNALSNFIPADERIITIEDSAELQITNVANLVSLETRNKNAEGTGEIPMSDLIKSSLRMRPDRIIVGEVRGKEALDMLQAMNTGHDGSLSTGHANSTDDMLSRLENMVLMAAPIPLDAIRAQISSALDIIIHLGRMRDKSRKVLAITEVCGYENGKVQLNTLLKFEEQSVDENGKIHGCLVPQGNKLQNISKFQDAGIDLERVGELLGY
jgi:pilus assembly protein CpaF